ncbi:hypothetical protein L226DRAFT_525319 [Lentinus tigrinus ALCF2SS1-7]|uniref:uncharacterized protein n=1 Tax=Lentinus tigrinus ALCF2SS1-7 TaxID=1328758 RepID=UPI001165EDE4|nr:hypothetical protein L226DRAFT_525319 [Lentinus tigrinus ALCF2SS1-7]
MQPNPALQLPYGFDTKPYGLIDDLVIQIAQSPGLRVAEEHIRRVFRSSSPLLGDPREPTYQYLDHLLTRAMHGLPPSPRFVSELRADPELLKTGAFVLFCTKCPPNLLNERFQDSDFLARLGVFLQSTKSRSLTCEVLISLAREEACDCRRVLENLIFILTQYPDTDFAPAAVAQAVCELILTSSEPGIDVLRSETFHTAYGFIKRALLDPHTPLPSLLPSIFRFFYLSLSAAGGLDTEFGEGFAMTELLPILMAFSKSQVIGVRCLAVRALSALQPLEGRYDRALYMVTGLDQPEPLVHQRLTRLLKTMSWQKPCSDSPFVAFYEACANSCDYALIIAEHYKGMETDWRALALALTRATENPGVRDPSIDMRMDTSNDSALPRLEDIAFHLLAALDNSFDPEAATVIRLLVHLVNDDLQNLSKHTEQVVTRYRTCAYIQCLWSLFPNWSTGLQAAKEGLLCRYAIRSRGSPDVLRDWMLRRAAVHAWREALCIVDQKVLGQFNQASEQLLAAFVLSAHKDLQRILYANKDVEDLPMKSPELVISYVLLTVALFGTQVPTSIMPWTDVVKRVDDLIIGKETIPSESWSGHHPEGLWERNYNEMRRRFCTRCESPAALRTVKDSLCGECRHAKLRAQAAY